MMIDPNSQKTLYVIANEVSRLLVQYGLIELERQPDGHDLMSEDHYAVYEDFTCSILDAIQNQDNAD